MYVIGVIPLIKATQLESLSYFSSVDYKIGTFLSVPVRGKNHPAIVLSSRPASEIKSTLKSATFTLRKLPEQKNLRTVPDSLLETTAQLSLTYPVTSGAILFQLLPSDIKDGTYQYLPSSSFKQKEDTTPWVYTAKRSERYIQYRSHIRSILARRGSVLFVVPTSADVSYASKHLSQGIEDRVVIFSTNQTKKAREDAYQAHEDTSIAKLIITTPTHAYLDRADLLSIIVDNSASDFYRTHNRPYLDHRDALTTYAQKSGRSIILGDIVPRTEEEYRRRTETYNTYETETKSISFNCPLSIVEQKDRSTPDSPFQLFSPTLKRRIENVLEAKGHIFLYSARRGMAPVVTCIDCGFIFRCPDSLTPYSLIKTVSKNGNEERWFVSSTSGKRVRASDTCEACGSWRLRTRGIGIQQVFDECRTLFPKPDIFILDRETATTNLKAEKIIKEFFDKRSSILIGTPFALPYLTLKGVDLSAVMSLDAARSTPTWRADENLFRLLFLLREVSEQEVILQTRTPTDNLLQNASSGRLDSFFDEEISLRASLDYPPFNTFVLITYSGDSNTLNSVEPAINKLLGGLTTPSFYNNPNNNEKSNLRHALIKIQDGQDHSEIINRLRKLPPFLKIEVNPPRIV